MVLVGAPAASPARTRTVVMDAFILLDDPQRMNRAQLEYGQLTEEIDEVILSACSALLFSDSEATRAESLYLFSSIVKPALTLKSQPRKINAGINRRFR